MQFLVRVEKNYVLASELTKIMLFEQTWKNLRILTKVVNIVCFRVRVGKIDGF